MYDTPMDERAIEGNAAKWTICQVDANLYKE